MPSRTTANLKYPSATYQSSAEPSRPVRGEVARGELRPGRETGLGAESGGHRIVDRAQPVPVDEEQPDVGQRIPERRHLPVQHRRDRRVTSRIDRHENIVEAVVAVHDSARCEIGTALPSRRRRSSIPLMSRLREASSWRPHRCTCRRGTPPAAPDPQPHGHRIDLVQIGEHVDQPMRQGDRAAESSERASSGRRMTKPWTRSIR